MSGEDGLRAVAFHEAGHAVAAAVLGLPVAELDIVPTEQRLGLTSFPDEVLFGEDGVFGPYADEHQVAAFGAMTWAGLLSQEKAGYPDPGGTGFGEFIGGGSGAVEGSDLGTLFDMASRCSGGPGDAERRLQEWQDLAAQTLDEHWNAVEQVVQALLDGQRLDGDALVTLMAGGCEAYGD